MFPGPKYILLKLCFSGVSEFFIDLFEALIDSVQLGQMHPKSKNLFNSTTLGEMGGVHKLFSVFLDKLKKRSLLLFTVFVGVGRGASFGDK